MQKKCSDCKVSKPIEQFNSQRKYCLLCHNKRGKKWRLENPQLHRAAQKTARKKIEKTAEWKKRQNSYSRNHYKNNKEKYIARSIECKKEIRRKFIAYKKTLFCQRCKESDYRCLQFHHLREKIMEISNMVRRGFSFKTIMLEIGKCIVLCANCHSKEHYLEAYL